MEQYHRERGKLEVPKGYTVKGVRLGRWVARSSPGSQPLLAGGRAVGGCDTDVDSGAVE